VSASNERGTTDDKRERKRARFDAPKAPSGGRRSGLLVATLVGVIVLTSAYFLTKGGDPSATVERKPAASREAAPATPSFPSGASAAEASAISPEGEFFRIPVSAITTGATFFKASAGGKTVPFFAVRDADGSVHVALDACHVCAEAKKGYVQKADHMVCRNCGKTFAISQITAMGGAGGCHPISLSSTVSGDSILVRQSDVAAGTRWF
jgi:hypothetical protein